MKMEGSRDSQAYVEAKKQYLAVGKRYSSILASVMKLDPNILKIAEEIMLTGDGLSTHDNRFVTSFYNELRAKSKIDKHYYDLLLELKKTKNELDHAVHTLSEKRVSFLLRTAGVPQKRTNQTKDIIAASINSPDTSLLEKISLPGVLSTDMAERLELMVSAGEIDIESGALTPRTRPAREFIKALEKDTSQRVNNEYFSASKRELLSFFHKLDSHNVLEFVRLIGDREHIREIERKISTKEIRLDGGGLVANNAKGKKYLALLTEELTTRLDKELRSEMLQKNSVYKQNDPRLVKITDKLADFDISESKHARLGKLASGVGSYQSLLKTVSERNNSLREALADLMLLQETIAVSFADIKKQLVQLTATDKVDINRVITLLMAVRYLSVFEKDYESKLTNIESMMGIVHHSGDVLVGPASLSRLKDAYGDFASSNTDETDRVIRDIITSKLSDRQKLGTKNNKTLIKFLISSPHFREYKEIIVMEQAARKHILDTLYSKDCMYQGIGNIGEIIAEIAELELEKQEKLVDLTHELELTHKELWLSKISSNNGQYIETNFSDLSDETKSRAKAANTQAISSARQEIQETLAEYRAQHQKYSDEFAGQLRKSLQQISKGTDVGKISADLKKKYRDMQASHEKLVRDMERDILKLEKRLVDFEQRTPKEIENMLMSDIRATI